jgi:drug/metabolite transporter (DMT)-like permease
MHQKELKSNLFLLVAAVIWGFAFVAQRIGAKYLGPFAFNGIRFTLGSFSLLPLVLLSKRQNIHGHVIQKETTNALPGGIIAGFILFMASSFQQIGLTATSAGKAAFITGLYIVLVPLLGIFLKHRIHLFTWAGVAAATAGLFLLSVTEQFTIAGSDLLLLFGAFLWSVHILVIDHLTKKLDGLQLSLIQFSTCAALSLAVACGFEKITVTGIHRALIPLLYGGICSVGVAYTLQVMGQRYAKPAHAALVLSLETVFAGLGGFVILHEDLGLRGYLGCVLMLAGMLLSQLPSFFGKHNSVAEKGV